MTCRCTSLFSAFTVKPDLRWGDNELSLFTKSFLAFFLPRPKVKQRIFPCGERPCQQVFVKRLAYIGVSTDIFGSVLLSYWPFKTEPWVLIGRLKALEFGCRSAVIRTFTISSQLLFTCLSLQCWSLPLADLLSALLFPPIVIRLWNRPFNTLQNSDWKKTSWTLGNL